MIYLTPREREIVGSILERGIPGLEVWAFGSRVDGNPRPFSDLDLAIVSDKPLSLSELAKLAEDFELSDLDFKVDLIDYGRLPTSWKARIEAHHETIASAGASSSARKRNEK